MLLTPKRIIPCALFLLSANSAFADATRQVNAADVYNLSLAELGQVQISIATGNTTPLDKAPATASVIYASEIEAMGARTLNDVLETVPGLHVSLSSLSRLDSVYSIRGIHTGFNPQVLLLVNGVPVQSTLQGSRPTLFRLPVASIARIEVIRGPGSAIYGADAYAGVINVITKNVSEIESTQISATTGSFGQRELSLQTATNWQGVGVAFDFAYQESNGDSSRRIESDLQSTLDSVLGTHASLAPGPLATRYHVFDSHLTLSGERFDAHIWNWMSLDAGEGAGSAQVLDPNGRNDDRFTMADISYRLSDSETWDTSIQASYLRYKQVVQFNILPPGTLLPIGSDGNINFMAPAGIVSFPDGLIGNPGGLQKDGKVELVSIFNGWDSQRVRFAVGSRYQSMDSWESKNFGPGVIDGTSPVVGGSLTDVSNSANVYLPDSSRSIRYVSLQDEWGIRPDLDLTAGVRYDKYSDFGATTNPRIALVWTLDESFTTKLLYGSAFRAPSFSELNFKNNPISLGNPNLKPERIDTLEWALNYRFNSNLQTTLTLFDYQAKDMIDFMPDLNASTKTARNARNQDGKGFEWELSWKPIPELRFSSSYSLQNATDVNAHTPIPDAPQHQIKLNADWQFCPDWFINSQLYWVGDRKRTQTDTRPDIANYTLLNLTLRRKNILPDMDLSFAVRNAANANAREPSSGEIPNDYPLESRSAWLEVSYRFR